MSPGSPRISAHILEEAAHWLVEVNEPGFDDEGRRRFNTWLRRSPEHVQAYLQMAALWEDTPAVAGFCTSSAAELIALETANSNIVAFPDMPATELAPAASAAGPPKHGGRTSIAANRRLRVWSIAATLLLLIGSLAGWQILFKGVYSTDLGERRAVTLNDGSSLELNSHSRVRVRFSGTERRLELLAGQALFRVAKDAARPFIVASDGFEVRAVGTQFDVYRKSDAMATVTVVEGRVAVSIPAGAIQPQTTPDSSPHSSQTSREVYVGAGEQMIVSAQRAAQPTGVDIETVTAWTRNQIVFRETPLSEVTEEFNRYNERQLVVDDADVGRVRINGSFSSADAPALLRFLRDLGEFEIDESGKDVHIRGRRRNF